MSRTEPSKHCASCGGEVTRSDERQGENIIDCPDCGYANDYFEVFGR